MGFQMEICLILRFSWSILEDFASPVWNFCRWVADVPPREKSLSGDERGETSAVRRLVVLMPLPIHKMLL